MICNKLIFPSPFILVPIVIMPIYAARWPDLSLSLLEAETKDDLFWMLDETANPMAVCFKKLSKPLHINLKSAVHIEKEKEKANCTKTQNHLLTLEEKMKKLLIDDEFSDLLWFV